MFAFSWNHYLNQCSFIIDNVSQNLVKWKCSKCLHARSKQYMYDQMCIYSSENWTIFAKKGIWKYHLQNVNHFVQTLIYQSYSRLPSHLAAVSSGWVIPALGLINNYTVASWHIWSAYWGLVFYTWIIQETLYILSFNCSRKTPCSWHMKVIGSGFFWFFMCVNIWQMHGYLKKMYLKQ